MRLFCLLLLIPVLRADELTLRMMARVSEEAEAFKKLAPEVLGEETLHQRSLRPQGRFHPRVGTACPRSRNGRERTIVSGYAIHFLFGRRFQLRARTSAGDGSGRQENRGYKEGAAGVGKGDHLDRRFAKKTVVETVRKVRPAGRGDGLRAGSAVVHQAESGTIRVHREGIKLAGRAIRISFPLRPDRRAGNGHGE